MPNLILLPLNDVIDFYAGNLTINVFLVSYLMRTNPGASLALLKLSREPLTEIQNRKPITYSEKDITQTFLQRFGVTLVFLTPESLQEVLADPAQNLVCYSSNAEVRHGLRAHRRQTLPLIPLPHFPLNQSHVNDAINGVRDAVEAQRQVIFWFDIDNTVTLPENDQSWTFNPAVIDFLFQLQSKFPTTFGEFQFKFLTSRVPVEQLNNIEKYQPYLNTTLIVQQFQEILRTLELQISLGSDSVVALGGYGVCPETKVFGRVSLKHKAAYLADQFGVSPNSTFVLVDDCSVQRKLFLRAMAEGRLSKERAFFIEVEFQQSICLSTPTYFKPNCSPSALLSSLGFLADTKARTEQQTTGVDYGHQAKP